MRKNQPPAQLIMLFQIRPIEANGSSSVLKRSHGSNRKTAAASRSSPGIVVIDW